MKRYLTAKWKKEWKRRWVLKHPHYNRDLMRERRKLVSERWRKISNKYLREVA